MKFVLTKIYLIPGDDVGGACEGAQKHDERAEEGPRRDKGARAPREYYRGPAGGFLIFDDVKIDSFFAYNASNNQIIGLAYDFHAAGNEATVRFVGSV